MKKNKATKEPKEPKEPKEAKKVKVASKPIKGRAKKNKKTLAQWAQESEFTTEFVLQEIAAGNLDLKLLTDQDGTIWVETNKLSLEDWAEENNFDYSWAQRWYKEDILPVKTTLDPEGNIWVQAEEILRSIKLTLQYATQVKKAKVGWLLEAYRAAVSFFIKSLWKQNGKLNGATLARLQNTRLTERYKSQALKQALTIVITTRKSAKELGVPASCPIFKGGAKLDKKFITIESSHLKDFDVCLKLSTLKKRDQIIIPTKRTQVLEKWEAIEGAELVQGCELREDSVIVWVKLPTISYKSEGTIAALDIGKKKLYNKIKKRKPGSQGRKEAYAQRENYLNATLNQLPWEEWRFLGNENLKGIKQRKGEKTPKIRRLSRILLSWNQSRVRERIAHKAQENRVFLVAYDPRDTSRRCPTSNGGCGKIAEANRQGEFFECLSCGYKDDADHVGALNGFEKTCGLLGSLESPKNKGEKESSEKSEDSGSS